MPVLRASANSLTKLVLNNGAEDLEYADCDSEFAGHHLLVSQLTYILPNLDYLDIRLHVWCQKLFEGPSCRPRKRNGTFILTFHPGSEYCNYMQEDRYLYYGTGSPSTAIQIIETSQPYFKEMRDWDVQIRLETWARIGAQGALTHTRREWTNHHPDLLR